MTSQSEEMLNEMHPPLCHFSSEWRGGRLVLALTAEGVRGGRPPRVIGRILSVHEGG